MYPNELFDKMFTTLEVNVSLLDGNVGKDTLHNFCSRAFNYCVIHTGGGKK